MLLSYDQLIKEEETNLTLNLQDLSELGKVLNDALYSDMDSWRKVSVEFNNPTTNQVIVIPLDMEEVVQLPMPLLIGQFTVSNFFQGNIAELRRIVIYDKGNGHLAISRDEIPLAANFDLNFDEE